MKYLKSFLVLAVLGSFSQGYAEGTANRSCLNKSNGDIKVVLRITDRELVSAKYQEFDVDMTNVLTVKNAPIYVSGAQRYTLANDDVLEVSQAVLNGEQGNVWVLKGTYSSNAPYQCE